jgi:asparagine synthase (glutamine-hydrolysing)
MRRRPPWLRPGLAPSAAEEDAARRDRGRDPSALNRELYYSLRWGNMPIILPYTDKTAMAHSVEARVPYLDRGVVELAFSLPDHYKVGGGDRKRLLRALARERLPREITERPDRMGFAMPDGDMIRGPMWPRVREAVTDPRLLGCSLLEPAAVAAFVEGFESGRHGDARAIWRLFALAEWSEAFGVGLP